MIVVNKTSIDFGFVSYLDSKQSTFLITNTGISSVNINDVFTSDIVYSVSESSFALSPNESKTILVTFSPTVVQTYNKTLTIQSSEPDILINLLGESVSAGIYVNKTSVDFGTITVRSQKIENVLVSNISDEDVALILSSVTTTYPDFKESIDEFKIQKGNALQIPVTFTPLSAGNLTGKLQITSNDTALPLVEVDLIGSGVLASNISLSTTAMNFGSVQVGETLNKTFKVFNLGDLNLNLTHITSDSELFSLSHINGVVLPGQSLTVNVSFSPLTLSPVSSKITILSNDPDTPSSVVNAQGSGLTSKISIEPTVLNFDDTNVGTTSSKSFIIYNNSTLDLVVSGIDVVGSTEFSINQTFPFSVITSKTINAVFNPTGLGIEQCTFNIKSNDLENPSISLPVSGYGVHPDVIVHPVFLDFLDVAVGQTSPLEISISNLGEGLLTITDISFSDSVFASNISSLSVEPNETKYVTVYFSPVTIGDKSGIATFNNNDPDTPNISVGLSGYGALPVMEVIPLDIDFGPVVLNYSKTETVTINNSGRAPLTVGIVSNSPLLEVSSSSLTVQQNSSQTFDVTFSPDSSGSFSSSITLLSNDPDSSTTTINITGSGETSAKIVVSPTSLIFSEVAMGNSQTLDLTVSNQGGLLLSFTTTLKNPVRPGRPLTFSVNPNSGSVPSNDSVTLSVSFSPNDPETITGTLIINSNDVSESELEIPLRGTGKPAQLAWDKINTASWIPTEIYTIATSLTNIVDPLVSALELTNQILDIVKLFIIDISDIMTVLLEQIKKTIDDFINDLAATGLYALYILPGKLAVNPTTYPQYFRSLPKSDFNIFDLNKPSWFDSVKGGYSSFISKIVDSFDDPADGNRPQLSDNAMVGAYVMMFDSGTVGPDDVGQFIRSIQKLMKLFRSPFKVAFEPPSNVSAFAGNNSVRVTFTPSVSALPKEYFIFRSETYGGDIVTYDYNGKIYPTHDENGVPIKSYELIGITNVQEQLADILGIGETDAESKLGEVGYAAAEISKTLLNGDPLRFVYEDTDVVNDKSYYYVVAAGYTTLTDKNYSEIKNVLSSDFDKKIVSTVDPDTMEPVEVEINPKSVTDTKILAIGALSAEVSAKPLNASLEVSGGLARCRNFRCGFDEDVVEFHRISGAEAPDFITIGNTPVAGTVRIKVTRNGNEFIANPSSYRVDYAPKSKQGTDQKIYQGATSKIFIKSRYYFKPEDILEISYKFLKELKKLSTIENVTVDSSRTFLTHRKPIDSASVEVFFGSNQVPSSEVTVLNDKDGRIKVNQPYGPLLSVKYDYYKDFLDQRFFKCVRSEYSRYFFDIAKCDGGATLCTGYDNANCYYNNGSECTNTEKSQRKILTKQGFLSEDTAYNLFWDPISCQNGMMQQRCDGYSKTFPRYAPKVWPDWSSVKLSALGMFPKIEEVMKIMQNLLDSLLAGTEKMTSAIENFIDLLQKKIDSLKTLLETIKSFLVTITEDFVLPDLYFLRIPYASGGNSYLKTSILNASNGPTDEPTAYTAGVVLVYATPGLGDALKLFFG